MSDMEQKCLWQPRQGDPLGPFLCASNFHSCELCMDLFYWLGRSQVFCEECLGYASMVRYARCEVLNQIHPVTLCIASPAAWA